MFLPHLRISPVVHYYRTKMLHHKRYLFGIFLTMPINVLLNQIIPPIILADVLRRLASGDFVPGDVWGGFGVVLIIYAAVVLVGSLLWRVIDYLAWRLEANVEREIGAQVFSHLLSQSARFHANNFSGSLVSQTNKLMGAYVRFADTTWFFILPLLFSLVFSLLVLAKVAPLFSIALLLFSLVYLSTALVVTKSTRSLGAKHANIESAQTGILADAVTNAMSVKSFASQRFEEQRFEKALNRTRTHLITFGNAYQKQLLYFGSLLSGISAISLLGAVMAVVLFEADVATVFLIFNYTANVGQQLFGFSNNAIKNYSRAIGDASEMVTTLNTPAEITDPTQPEPLRVGRGDVRFDDVSFSHENAEKPIFTGLNLRIKPGEKVGLVGRSGSGKTTLTRILLRFADIQAGSITLDGQNIAHITQDDLRSTITYVPQEPLLFHRTIKENIAYGDPDADDAAIQAVAKMSHADEFIRELPKGYDTLVGERGVKLSGGQRQRIAIARSMLKNAPILVLDEATSALDSESEVLIQDALWKLMEGKTAIVIAHRLSTIQKMDRIIVLDDGDIIEEGTHKTLLAKGGTYAKLWAHQSGGFIDA